MDLDGHVLTFLANALWQVPAVVVAAALAARLLRRAPARHRHALWLAALALVGGAAGGEPAARWRGRSGETGLG